ncbi:MAG: cytochrome c oxidase subunit [Solirubrobacteraceae bacterium]|jgi:cytochrome c oxidase subunit 2|nr:cytochrome c oxidase subunit [Solirubrobacteraceae bacterium]
MDELEHETPHRPAQSRRSLVPAFVIAAIATAGGIVLGLVIPWFPPAADTQAKSIDTLYYVLIIVTVPVFVLVETVVLFAVVKFRMRPGEEMLDGPPIHGNTRLEIIWTAAPSAIIAALVVYAAVVLRHIEHQPAGEIQVQVYAQQFAWSFAYPPAAPGAKAIVSSDLYLVKDRPVRFRVHSSDVLHGFWIPAFRLQIDAVPGTTQSFRATPKRMGDYDIVCTELCGLGHSVMRSTAHVVTPAAYTAFLASRGAASALPAAAGPGALAAMGKRVFTSTGGCGACHTLADAQTTGSIGPDLNKYLKGKSEAFIRTSIVNPNAYVEKGFGANIMPANFGTTLSKDELGAVVKYLANVTAK